MKRKVLLVCSIVFFGTTAHAQWTWICSEILYFNDTKYCNFDLDSRDSIKIQCLNDGDGADIHSFPRIVIKQGTLNTLLDSTYNVAGNKVNIFYGVINPDLGGTDSGNITLSWTISGGAQSVNVDIYKKSF